MKKLLHRHGREGKDRGYLHHLCADIALGSSLVTEFWWSRAIVLMFLRLCMLCLVLVVKSYCVLVFL